MRENKFFKYILYAVGEIILVVIGILIALWINNWNNEQEQRKLEVKYLKEIKINLTSDLKDIDFNIEFNEQRLRSNKIIMQFLNKEISYSDSLRSHFATLIYSTRTIYNSSAYDNIKSRGLEIISNDSLRQRITKLYSFDFHNAVDFEIQDDHAFQYGVLIPEVNKALNVTIAMKEAEPIDQRQLLTNYAFKSAIVANIGLREYMLETYEALKKDVKACIVQIDRQLDVLEK